MYMVDIDRTEYALEEYYKGEFYNQIDILYDFQSAFHCAHELNLKEYVIRAIYYDENRNEVATEILFSSTLFDSYFSEMKGEIEC